MDEDYEYEDLFDEEERERERWECIGPFCLHPSYLHPRSECFTVYDAEAAYIDELDAAGESVVGVKGW